eukprot:COSAG01_NODE_12305_length_1763_cov_1.043870_2_plen_108_part_00
MNRGCPSDTPAMRRKLGGLEVLPERRRAELLRLSAAWQGAGVPGSLANPGTRRLGDLVNKGQCFDAVWTDPLLLSLVASVLPGPFHLHSLNGHDPLPGYGRQALHAE